MKIFDESLNAVFLLIIAVCGNFVAETLSCSSKKLLMNNMVAKQLIIFIIIYFAHNFTTNNNPIKNLVYSLLIFILFIMFTKMELNITIITFIMLCISYIINDFILYYKGKDKEIEDSNNGNNGNNEKLIKSLNNSKKILYISIIILILYGFTVYYHKKRKKYKNDWNTLKYIFGTIKCNSIK